MIGEEMKCEICFKPEKEDTEGDLKYCQGHKFCIFKGSSDQQNRTVYKCIVYNIIMVKEMEQTINKKAIEKLSNKEVDKVLKILEKIK